MISRFLNAARFLTVLPFGAAGRIDNRDLARSMAAFPLVGGLLGLIMAGTHLAIGGRIPQLMEGALLVALIAYLTGGFHLDGVADTADGLGGGYTPERSLEIMKDSRIGALGAIALTMVLLLKVAGIGYLDPKIAVFALIATPAAARGGVVFMAFKAPYARPQGGLGSPYTEHLDWFTVVVALGFSAGFSLLLGWRGALAFTVAFAWCCLLKVYFKRRLGGVTGDTLGFAEETGEIAYLLALHLVY